MKCRQLVESTQRGRGRHNQRRRVVVPIKSGSDNSVRDAGHGKLAGSLVHQLPAMGENGGAATLAGYAAADIREDDRLAAAGWQAIADRPSPASVGRA